ncbi:branched-chain amino acid ABC transporter permease [Roseovarius atlanticus]|uniref:branched-chain amino acid ABC transporter permease n=1 Tax=Roseovarius atlanticus TaxID=1641875 RepID=UPI001C969020|nr:branched-chain amino acid ABC transporter permease [Roseovarius atlanticus]MBY5989966.1 branched-chain amino acid ABC transporter permease [Roseovarius atlanticus]MBY6126511.1 branched-chain amino acid ABC transporter permease [Roseovarius atlanticus]MBY6151005.1 branched-chain amino acid ABC transporter permease [Roseovarius atlanticus]
MRRTIVMIAGLVVLALVPAFVTDSYTRHLFILAFVYAVIASNWDLSLGYAGLFNFGHLAFFATGVYTAAIAAKTFGIDPWLAIPMGGVTAMLAALLVALPVARLKGIYVVLVTFGFSQLLLQLILSQSQITGGAGGMVRIPGLEVGDYRFIRDFKFGYYYVALGLLTISTLYLLWLTNTSFGKSLLAVRDNEDYAQARGISIARQRILSLVASAVFPGIAGGFFAIYLRVAAPEVLSFGTLSLALSMVLIGGTATIYGPIIAAVLLTFATEAMAGIRGWEEARFLVVAIGMILVLRFAPGGLARVASGSK